MNIKRFFVSGSAYAGMLFGRHMSSVIIWPNNAPDAAFDQGSVKNGRKQTMKKSVAIIMLTLLLWGCSDNPASKVGVNELKPAVTGIACSPSSAYVEELPQAKELPTVVPELIRSEAAGAEESLCNRVVDAWTSAGYLEDMIPYSEVDLLDMYGVDSNQCIFVEGYGDSDGYTKEAVIIEADEKNAAMMEDLLVTHLDRVRDQFRSYDPAALALVEKAVMLRENGIVLMIVSPDAQSMLGLYREFTD